MISPADQASWLAGRTRRPPRTFFLLLVRLMSLEELAISRRPVYYGTAVNVHDLIAVNSGAVRTRLKRWFTFVLFLQLRRVTKTFFMARV
jgi:hypothetical protein